MVFQLKKSVGKPKGNLTLVMVMLCLLVFSGCRPQGDLGASFKPSVNPGDSVTSFMMAVSGMYIDASKEKILGNFSQAIQLLKDCIKTDPGHHPSYYQIADVYHITGDYREALYWIEEALKLEGTNIWYRVLYGDILLKLGRYKDADDVYTGVIKTQPGKRMWYEGKAYAQDMSGNVKGAAETYKSILERFGYDEEIFLKMLTIYEKSNDHRRVEQSLKWLIEKYPYETKYLGALAAYYLHRGRGSRALPLWQEILRLEPENGEVRFDLANYYRSRGEDNKAYEQLLEAFSSPNLSIDSKIVVLLSYYNLSEKYPSLIPEAYNLLEVVVMKHPENPKGWSMYGDFLFRDRSYEAAWHKMKKVVELDSSRYLVWEQLLNCAWIMRDYVSLREDGEKALRIFPEQSLLYLYHGTGLLYGEKPEDALVTFRQGIYFAGLNDSISAALEHGMARVYELEHKAPKAEEYYQRALKKGYVSNAMAADQLRFAVTWSYKEQLQQLNALISSRPSGDPMLLICDLWNRLQKGGRNEVEAPLRMLTEKYPGHYLVMEHATDIYIHVGMKDEAAQTWVNALKLSKGNLLKR